VGPTSLVLAFTEEGTPNTATGSDRNVSAHQAVAKAQQYMACGHYWVVDLDLEKFFARVNHDRRMAAIARRVADQRVLRLSRET
jgi:retron-type reverse transcriptase